MVHQDSHQTIVDRIVLLIDDTSIPDKTIWEEVLGDCQNVTIADGRSADTDAILASVSVCERYGCRSGSSEDTLGVMNVYDSWLFHDRSEYYPRFFISNAVWREETSIDTAISKRINILASTITKFNTNNPEKIKSITIECLTLGSWGDHSDDKKHRAIRLVKEKLQETFGIICD